MSTEKEEPTATGTDPESALDDPVASESRNIAILAIQNIVLRTGWIFKTETVIMPAFLDLIDGAGWTRGWLPILSRVGQSLTPMMYADRLRGQPLKKRSLLLTATGMGLPFLLLAFVWSSLEDKRQAWLAPLFLALYFLFFSATGLNQVVFGTLEGKLIRPQRRGRLMGISGFAGSICAVTAAILLLGPWLALPDNAGFTYVFLFNGVSFLLAGMVSIWCVERPDPVEKRPLRLAEPFLDAWRLYRRDKAFRRAARVAMLFISSLLVFPHYQWLGRERIGTTNEDLIVWVIAQNISLGVYSPIMGIIADRCGYRLAIRWALFLASLTPIVAILFGEELIPDARRWYWLTFVLLGLTPMIMKSIFTYTLELSEPAEHPRYLSTMRVVFAVPFVFSPLVGWMLDVLPYQYPFLMVAGLVFLGGVLTFWMSEPRQESLAIYRSP